ncbi:SPOR domain-containing protein [Methylicorpusculum oleiharenae]|uniref:SPOR domain-containing protein n=1 Tax=Methylicorpusculum oleiharenae TaxID=1338687 RepID=UPI00135B11F6|nr:SPOR domain-containing protein [Methylicorpusculum oleiharenae]MCD2449555.1 SPOR domain-containing protein [Methylicorpusculum oleiharenae]
MSRDYKNRGRGSRVVKKPPSAIAGWKWVAIAGIIVAFGVFLFSLKDNKTDQAAVPQPVLNTTTPNIQTTQAKPAAQKPKPVEEKKAEEPHFDFYTILPAKEVVIPEYEIKTRVREERVGKAKESKYTLQAGSFRDFGDADRLRAKLALMGLVARVEKAKVGDVIWNRVKLGPYEQMTSVTTIKDRLKKNGIDAMVTEGGR